MPESLEARLADILLGDPDRRACLQQAAKVCQALGIEDYLLAAGFVRNAVWDSLHGNATSALNDVDLIYLGEPLAASHFNSDPALEEWLRRARLREQQLTYALNAAMPEVPWEVRDQRRMHLKHGDGPYHTLADAMAAWPEKETAVGVRLQLGPDSFEAGQLPQRLSIVAPWQLESLFALKLTPSPYRAKDVFLTRVQHKGWLLRYPRLTLA